MSSTRQMVAVAVSAALWLFEGSVAAQDQPRFTVSGVVINDGASVAWLGEPSYTKNRLQRVREGDSVGPYKVVAIREDRVELVGPTGPVVVRLTASAPDMPATPAVGAVAPAPTSPSSPASGPRPRPQSPAAVPTAGTAQTPTQVRGPLTPEQEAKALADMRARIDAIRGSKPRASGWSKLVGQP
jgi:hypothetical protein